MVILLTYVLFTRLVSDSKFNFVTEFISGPIFISFQLLRVYIYILFYRIVG